MSDTFHRLVVKKLLIWVKRVAKNQVKDNLNQIINFFV